MGGGIDLQDARHGAVEKSAVVRDDQHAAGVGAEVTFQPLQSGDVQVVGGLVQHQESGVFQQDAGQAQARLLAAAEDIHRRVGVQIGQPQPG
jgi:hypothetical protein